MSHTYSFYLRFAADLNHRHKCCCANSSNLSLWTFKKYCGNAVYVLWHVVWRILCKASASTAPWCIQAPGERCASQATVPDTLEPCGCRLKLLGGRTIGLRASLVTALHRPRVFHIHGHQARYEGSVHWVAEPSLPLDWTAETPLDGIFRSQTRLEFHLVAQSWYVSASSRFSLSRSLAFAWSYSRWQYFSIALPTGKRPGFPIDSDSRSKGSTKKI